MEKEEKLLNYQLITSIAFIVSLIISIILTYDEKAILPLYFSTSSGKTENCEEVFSSQYPYLKSVSSPYEEQSPR